MSRRADEPAKGQPDNKRARTDAPAPAAMNIADIRARLAAKKAEVEARLAAQTSSPAASTPPPPAASTSSSATASVSAGPAALPPKPQIAPSTVDKIAAAKKRIEAMTARSSNPYLSGSGSMPKPEVAKPTAGAMSSIALHPLLMGGQQGQEQQVEKNEKRAMRDRYKPMAPKFSSVKANVGAAPTSSGSQAPVSSAVINPYASSSTANPAADEPVAPTRRSRKIHFAPQGKYVEQGNQLRNDAKMEELKQRIIAQSKKAGLDSEFDTLERSLKRNPPPDVEWWDKPLLNYGSTYDDIEGAIKWVTENPTESMVTHLVQHPIPIPAPGDKKADERGLMLTKKEQKKMRRQRRKAELEDKRDRQKMGLLPPDAPKVRLANLMKVLTSDAVQDPTKVEAKVRKEVTARANKHEDDNEARKLTVEQRQEKEYQKMLAKERQAVFAAVYKIKYLTNGRHKFKVRETAKKDHLSGVCIFNPHFALVLVEGVDKGIKHYKQLLLNRIDWTEQARPLAEGEEEGDDEDADAGDKAEANGDSPDMAENKCELIWEGEVQERTFKQFRARHSESDTSAKEWLTPKWEGMWDLAKRWVWNGEDL